MIVIHVIMIVLIKWILIEFFDWQVRVASDELDALLKQEVTQFRDSMRNGEDSSGQVGVAMLLRVIGLFNIIKLYLSIYKFILFD